MSRDVNDVDTARSSRRARVTYVILAAVGSAAVAATIAGARRGAYSPPPSAPAPAWLTAFRLLALAVVVATDAELLQNRLGLQITGTGVCDRRVCACGGACLWRLSARSA
jgi:hypothetical protein